MPKIEVVLTPEKEYDLFMLGRYAEKVYLQIHNLCRCQELLDEGKPQEYAAYYERIGSSIRYNDKAEARAGLMYDSRNTESVLTSIENACKYAEGLDDVLIKYNKYYLDTTLALMKYNSNIGKDPHLEDLQRAADLALAFWGSVDERIYDHELRSLLFAGKLVEHIVMSMKLHYKWYRVEEAFTRLLWIIKREDSIYDKRVIAELEYLIIEPKYCPEVDAYRNMIISLFDRLIKK